MQEFKVRALQHLYLIKNYLNVTISEKLTPVAIAQKLLNKVDLRLSRMWGGWGRGVSGRVCISLLRLMMDGMRFSRSG
ncbi:hypothetical protein ACX27_21900 [Nostoc piscinale CENA21]|uniref:Uncharacterized protein n=1 Tax=Nostoc piscinale CENA21 TaxID=224013 RepID=A0A0M4STX8_9NOSO|nr:hypothetical protein ACX27_21900 [Nostoc piscinale CENA21]